MNCFNTLFSVNSIMLIFTFNIYVFNLSKDDL